MSPDEGPLDHTPFDSLLPGALLSLRVGDEVFLEEQFLAGREIVKRKVVAISKRGLVCTQSPFKPDGPTCWHWPVDVIEILR